MKNSVSGAGRDITWLVAVLLGTLHCLSYRSGSR